MTRPAHLADGDYQELLGSGLSVETMLAADVRSYSPAETSAFLGYGASGSLFYPYRQLGGSNGGPPQGRVKLHRAGPDGKRYRTRKGDGNHLYVPPMISDAMLADLALPIYWTEGEKKSLKASQEGLCCIALAGVWSFLTHPDGDKRKPSVAIADLDAIPLEGRVSYVVFDADITSKPDVQRAEAAFAAELGRRGSTVYALRLPGPEKGLDDYLLTHTVEHLCDLPPIPLASPPPARLEPPQAIELHALMARQYPDDPGIVGGGVVPRRCLAVVAGGPKIGKTNLVDQLVLERESGRNFLGQFPTTPGRSLVVNAEIPEPALQKRLGLHLLRHPAPPEGAVHFLTDRRLKLDVPGGKATLRRHLERIRPDLLVLDPLARLMVGDENSAQEMGALIAVLDELIQDFDLAIILVHHSGKPGPDGGAREGGHRLRGSSALYAAADTILLLDKLPDKAFRLSFELRHAEEPAPIHLRRDGLWFIAAGPPDELLAVAYLVSTGPLRWGHFVEATRKDQGASKRTAERLVDRTKKAALVDVDSDGYYTASATYRHFRGGAESSA